jgi:hypothetical protein
MGSVWLAAGSRKLLYSAEKGKKKRVQPSSDEKVARQ